MNFKSDFYIEKGEAIEILICVMAISLALAFAFGGLGILLNLKSLLFILSFFVVTVGSGFIFHEMGHKLAAIYYGAYARFRMWPTGLAFMFLTAILLGFVFAAPGAVYIYSRSITKRQNGIISIAGPLTNILLFFIFLGLAIFAPVRFYPLLIFSGNIWLFGAYINAILAFFNMLPISPLDGSKILSWNKLVWLLLIGFSFFAWMFLGGLA